MKGEHTLLPPTPRHPKGIENSLGSVLARIDEQAVSALARHESRNRETHLPPLGVFRWWARRTGAVNDAILSSAVDVLGKPDLDIFDPFAGGGTIPLVALRAGHRVHAQDLNPWAVTGVRQMLTLPSRDALENAHAHLGELAAGLLNSAYSTTSENEDEATILHTYRVAVGRCGSCEHEHRQFPYSLLTLKYRKERRRTEAILACPSGHVFFGRSDQIILCPVCSRKTDPADLYTPRRIVTCPECNFKERLSNRAMRESWHWEVVLVERADSSGRKFDLPTTDEILQADEGWEPRTVLGNIPSGSETSVLLRHGYTNWSDLYPNRQRVVTETLLDLAGHATEDPAAVSALKLAIIGSTEFAGHLCRWDRFYLKCNDSTAGHRFNFSTFVPEFNVWGVKQLGRGTVTRRVRAMSRASDWLSQSMGRSLHIEDSWRPCTDPDQGPDAWIVCADSGIENGPPKRFDLVLTDPPYHDDVQYGELSLPFREWSGLPVGDLVGEASTNHGTGTNVAGDDYSNSIQRVFTECARTLRTDGRLIFSYANREPGAWIALFRALSASRFSAIACLSVHSENETDFKKRDVMSCTEDLLMELTPSPRAELGTALGGVQNPFMEAVASWFCQVGHLESGWEQIAWSELSELCGH